MNNYIDLNMRLFNRIHPKYRTIVRNALIAFVVWMITMMLLYLGKAEVEIMAAWALIMPFAILFYVYSFIEIIPGALSKRRRFLDYMIKSLVYLFFLSFPVTFIMAVTTGSSEDAVVYALSNLFVQFVITAPVCWFLFKRYIKGNEEIFVLKKELRQATASFDFLRSQINPHFLFKALNTIYGTAIQEKAERTSEAVEKLGDMMRFMLQENMQEQISLSREVDYLENYISLQKLRTATNPDIVIRTEIQNEVNNSRIAPMLLIPFVENAFKHGISLREPSQISITLEVKEGVLHFDVYNSKHPRPESDPEKNKSGIGLKNVKQRLRLLYPNRHELVIRDTVKEFFVHLTIQLS